ncbi:hypothetical protein C8J57DRAFT_625535 [Mycena rebaudengoi]|nr:hypothetical protein C8J57DRAFT_625535 [Mycena rebaudengoi]
MREYDRSTFHSAHQCHNRPHSSSRPSVHVRRRLANVYLQRVRPRDCSPPCCCSLRFALAVNTMESPFKHMLNTNAIPEDAEYQQIHDFLVEPRKEAAHLAEQIARMQKLLEDLTHKHDDLTELIDAHLALISPARRLPDDVVREIFVASLPANRNCAISAKESPLLLCAICQSWRHLALSTPQLWASVHIVAPLNDKIERMINTVHAWLSRSGAFPLSISLTVSRGSTWPPPDASSLLTTLIRYSLRWKHIRFILPPDQFEPLSSLSPEDVPVLEKAIVVGSAGQYADHTIMSPRLAFLQTTSLSSVNAQFIPPQTPIRLEFLRHLSFDVVGAPQPYIAAQSALEILRRCALLETCTILIVGDLDGSSTPCRMEHLRHFCVRSAGGAPRFFETLVLPNLRRLEYSGQTDLHFLPLLTSAQSVECLVLNSGAETADLLAVLRLTPMLEELDLTDDQFIPLLTPHAESEFTVMCPQLRHITLMRFNTLSDAALLEFILARKGLTRIDVLFSREMQVDIAPSVQHLLAAGLSLSVEYQPFPPIPSLYSPSDLIEENYDRRSMYQ